MSIVPPSAALSTAGVADTGSGSVSGAEQDPWHLPYARPSGSWTVNVLPITVPSGTLAEMDEDPGNDHRWLARVLDDIANTFGLDRKALAVCCRVSRPALYAWLRGESAPQELKLQRIYRLNSAAATWQSRSYPSPGLRLTTPVVRGKSLLEILSAESIDIDAVDFVGRQWRLEARSRR